MDIFAAFVETPVLLAFPWVIRDCAFSVSSGLAYRRTGSKAEIVDARLAISLHADS